MRQVLSARQSCALDFIRTSIATRGYPPTIREIAAHMGMASTNGVNDHLIRLERKGYIVRSVPGHSRGIRLLSPQGMVEKAPAPLAGAGTGAPAATGSEVVDDAGPPSSAGAMMRLYDQKTFLSGVATSSLVPRTSLAPTATCAVITRGNALINMGIRDGDWLFIQESVPAVEEGQLVLVAFADDVAVRFYFLEGEQARFNAANESYPALFLAAAEVKDAVLGVVVGVYRHLRPAP